MSVTLGDIYVAFKGDNSGALKTMDETERRAQSWAGRVSGFVSNALSTATGFIVAQGVTRITNELTSLGPKLINMGSDTEEMMGKFNVVFGDEADRTIGKLNEMTKVMGRSKFEARGFAASFQDTFVPMGFARDEAANLSTRLTELTYDVASFNNSLEPDVARDFQSALVGNHETVRKYGIVITQAALDSELMRMGIEDGTKSATEQEKVMARLNLIMAGTSDAQGDAERTSKSWANTMRRFKSSISDTATEIGMKLLPVVTPLLQSLADFAQNVGPKVAEKFSDIIGKVSNLASAFITLLTTSDQRWTEAAAFIQEKLGAIGSAIVGVVEIVQEEGWSALPSYLAQQIANAWPAIQTEITTWPGRFWEWLTGEYGVINAGVFLIMHRFAPQIAALIGAVWPDIAVELQKWATDFWNWLTEPEGALTKASDKLNNISIEFSKWVNGIGNDSITNLGNEIGKFIGDGIAKFFSAEGGGSDSTIKAVFQNMMDATNRNVENFQGIGATIETLIITGFIRAITGQDVAEDTAATIRNVLLSIVKLTSPASIGIELFNQIWTPFKNAWDSSISFLKGEGATATVGEMMPFGLGNVLPGFAGGGEIPGREGQAVPIMAHAGEVLLNREQQAAMARETRVYINNLNLNGVQNVSSFLAELEALT